MVYDFYYRVFARPVGDGIVGFDAFKKVLTCLVMACQELHGDLMVANTTWTALYLLNRLLEEIQPDTEARVAYLSRLTNEELEARWKRPDWAHGVDNPVDEADPPF